MTNIKKELKNGEIICKQGDDDTTLYLVENGKLLVFGLDGTKVTPFAYIKENEFVGELSYFDGKSRSAYVMAIEDTTLMTVPPSKQTELMPDWMIKLGINLTKRLRHIDNLISHKGIKRSNVDGVKPLSIDEQREIYQRIQEA
ncbi:MAG: hypothetical protein BM556_16355 [Bacteriovorax sp. MedPE-SWde]|nr:MAG: hypothetical protein BM556_16355 [Bacteriovorax sp. MedPE-SWde]